MATTLSDTQTAPSHDIAPALAASEVFDAAVVGADIDGLAVARELRARHPGLSIVVVERESSVRRHQTGHNSGVIDLACARPKP